MTTEHISVMVAVIVSTLSVAWAFYMKLQYEKAERELAANYAASVKAIFESYDQLKEEIAEDYRKEMSCQEKA